MRGWGDSNLRPAPLGIGVDRTRERRFFLYGFRARVSSNSSPMYYMSEFWMMRALFPLPTRGQYRALREKDPPGWLPCGTLDEVAERLQVFRAGYNGAGRYIRALRDAQGQFSALFFGRGTDY